MPATTKPDPTYTHVGRKPNTAYVHMSSRLAGHGDIVPGKGNTFRVRIV